VKILIISHYNPETFEYGGLATFVRNLSRGLKSLGHEVHYISVSPTMYRKYDYVRVISSGFRPHELDLRLHEVIKYCVDYDGIYDVVIANDYFSPCVTRKSKLIAYIHNFVGSPWELVLMAYADKVCTNSKLNKSLIDPHLKFVKELTKGWVGKEGVEEVEVLYPPPPEPPEKVEEVRGLELNEPILCYVGRTQDYKNLNMFKKLVVELGVNGLVISHDVESSVDVFRRGSDEIAKIVYFGNIPEEMKWGLMKKCTLGIYPSLFEPYGLVPLEFVRAGVPVVVSKNCGVVEVLEPVTFDPNNFEELVRVVKEVLKYRDDYLNELTHRQIMYRTWREFAEELINV
jgi:glycosyltransferase involved in cell wall biosynthesis